MKIKFIHYGKFLSMSQEEKNKKSSLQKLIDKIAEKFSIKRRKNIKEKKNKSDDDDNLSEDIYPLW